MKPLFLLTIFFLTLPILFQGIYIKKLRTLREETKNIKPIKISKNFLILLFKKKKKNWLIRGSLADLSKLQKVVINDCYAKNFLENITISARKAFYYPFSQKIKLVGDVKLTKLNTLGKPLETVLTDLAFIDLQNNRIYGPQNVILRKGKIILIGKGFIYDAKSGRFKIISDVQTLIGFP